MRHFLVRHGVFIKTNRDVLKIMNTIIISMIPFVILKLIVVRNVIGFLMCLIFPFIFEGILNILKKNKRNIKYYFLDSYTLFGSFILYLFVEGSNYIAILIGSVMISLLKVVLENNKKININPYLWGLVFITFFNKIEYIDTNIYIIISVLISIIVFIYLSIKRYIKVSIMLTYITSLFIIYLIIFLLNDLDIKMTLLSLFNNGLLILGIYLASYSRSTPLTRLGQVIYGNILAILTVVFSYLTSFNYVIISIALISLLTEVIDKFTVNIYGNKRLRKITIFGIYMAVILTGIIMGI